MTKERCYRFLSRKIIDTISSIRSSDATSKILGIKNPQTISHYYKGTWEDFKEELKR